MAVSLPETDVPVDGPVRPPWLAAAQVLVGLVVGVLVFQALPHDPTSELRSLSAPPDPLASRPALRAPKEPGELRIVVVGASLTSGFPYAPEISYAGLIQRGLAPLLPDRKVVCVPVALPGLDSTQLSALVDRILPTEPDIVCVALGFNEVGGRLFADKALVPDSVLAWLGDRSTRARSLFRGLLQPPAVAEETANDRIGSFLNRLGDARPAEPLVSVLPVSRRDRSALADRLQRNVERIARRVREAGAELVLCSAPFDRVRSWPCAMTEVVEAIDEVVLQHWFSQHGLAEPVPLATVADLIERYPERADLRRLSAALQRRAGPGVNRRPGGRDADFWGAVDRDYQRGRDLDPGPLHTIGEMQSALRAVADALGVPYLDFDVALAEPLRPWPDPDRFVDPAHVTPEGHVRLAEHLLRTMVDAGVLPKLKRGWATGFRAELDRFVGEAVTPEIRSAKTLQMALSMAAVHMLFGNLRDAIPVIAGGLEFQDWSTVAPTDPRFVEWGWRLVLCTVATAGRLEELLADGETARATRGARLMQGLHAACLAGQVPQFVKSVLDGAPF